MVAIHGFYIDAVINKFFKLYFLIRYDILRGCNNFALIGLKDLKF